MFTTNGRSFDDGDSRQTLKKVFLDSECGERKKVSTVLLNSLVKIYLLTIVILNWTY
jgi:hypothetical protein